MTPRALRGWMRSANHVVRGQLGWLGLYGTLSPPILCVGAPNSGTTLLGDALGAHPDVENRSEARVLWDPSFHHAERTAFRAAEDVRPSDVRRLRGNFAYYQRSSGARVVLNKHPENSLRIHWLMRVFPEALLVHIVRDGRAAVCSNFTSASRKKQRQRPFGDYVRPRDWREHTGRPLLEQLAYMWNECATYASEEGAKYGEQFVEVRYEDLGTELPALARRVWGWAGLEVEDAQLALLPRVDDRNHKWRETLTPEQVATIERVARPGLERFGYLRSSATVDAG